MEQRQRPALTSNLSRKFLYNTIKACGGVLAHAREGSASEIHFTLLPSPSKGVTTKEWFIRDLPAQESWLAMDPELNLLVIIEYIMDLDGSVSG